jgi:predicted metal-binding protein
MEREFIMDPNNFSLDALLSSSEFSSVESAKTGYSYSELENFLKDNVKDDEVSSEIKRLAEDYMWSAYNDAFKQGFCFAVKSIKFLLKI